MPTKNKKGVSIIIGYVLLIIVAVGLSVLVFAYLKLYAPKDKPECKQDVHLIVQDYSCTSKVLTLTLLNKGLFKIDAAYVRIGQQGREVRELINGDNIYFGIIDNQKGLFPGKTFTKTYVSQLITSGNLILEVQPAVFDNNDLAICENAVISQQIKCVN